MVPHLGTAFTFTHPAQYSTPTITISNHVEHAVAVEATSIANTSGGWAYYVHASSGCRGVDHVNPCPGADPESLQTCYIQLSIIYALNNWLMNDLSSLWHVITCKPCEIASAMVLVQRPRRALMQPS